MDLDPILHQIGDAIMTYGPKLLIGLIILLVGRWVGMMAGNQSQRGLNKRGIDPTISGFVAKLVYVGILIFTVVAALSHIGLQTTSFVAALGAAGLAVGLALQGSLSNFAAGVLLVLFRPCRVGDYVDAGGVSGTVRDISLFSTTMLTPDNKQIIVPNSGIMGGPITNYSAMATRRIDLVIGISYDSDIRLAKDTIQALIDADERILKDPAPTIAVSELAESSVNLVVRPWASTANYWAVRFALIESIKNRFDEVGVGIPFPQIDVHMPEQPQDKAAA